MHKGAPTASDVSLSACRSVGQMFDDIAPTYDLLNHLLSLARDRSWRRRAVGRLDVERTLRVVDLATGTGDLLIAMLRDRPNITEAVGLDLSPNMLEVCRRKLRQRELLARARLLCEDASATSFPEDSFDAVTMAFGIRNTADVLRTLQEMLRILRPGGTALVLEFSLPANRLVRRCYLAYLRVAVPLIGSLVSRNKTAYRYLNQSIEGFHAPPEFLALMREAGFSSVAAVPLTFGVASIYCGTKPEGGPADGSSK
ncbi:MAG: bifunctional demethylmenaquinone methyltransferase/2-methoxy-6-polyprenyl-1,4-benzoquinol methylase UbiE [Sedimentisphaerales bacterium]|nr:bifunctional demethylmenaquinone methyltransferase/2-methoxy-6-polyprenyl-1,4-benzoquinol methylase UbiE [Sedimentisphaerales bacterium]